VKGELSAPRIPYRETITSKGDGQGRHKKQSGGKGQFGDCWIRMRPGPRGSGYVFQDEIVGGAIPRAYIPAVDRGVVEAAARGVLAGYPMVDFVVECYDGSYHSVDSNEASFKMAGIQAFKTVAPKCRPALLEPLEMVEVTTPDAYLGDVMGDLSSRRGHILGTEPTDEGSFTRVRAIVPQGDMHLYATKLSSIAHGRAVFSQRFHGYEHMPGDAAAKIIETAAKSRGEEAAD
jgi:elongation factor G